MPRYPCGLPYSVAGLPPASPGFLGLMNIEGLRKHTALLEPLHDASDRRGRDTDPSLTQQDHQLVLPPSGILGPELEDPVFDRDGGQGLAAMTMSPAGRFQGSQAIRVEPALPAVKGLLGNRHIPAELDDRGPRPRLPEGKGDLHFRELRILHPGHPPPSNFATNLPF